MSWEEVFTCTLPISEGAPPCRPTLPRIPGSYIVMAGGTARRGGVPAGGAGGRFYCHPEEKRRHPRPVNGLVHMVSPFLRRAPHTACPTSPPATAARQHRTCCAQPSASNLPWQCPVIWPSHAAFHLLPPALSSRISNSNNVSSFFSIAPAAHTQHALATNLRPQRPPRVDLVAVRI